MIGNYFEFEANKNDNYCRVIQTYDVYKDGRYFPIDKEVNSDNKVNLSATDRTKIGGFCISTYDYIFRWLIRGDTLCDVIIPEDSKIYKTVSENGIYVSDKIILTNPRRIDDDFAMELYLKSKLPEKSYFKALAACSIMGYINTAFKVCSDKVNKNNIDIAIKEFEDFCFRREEENLKKDCLSIESAKIIYEKLNKIKNEKI